jgi:glycosyltransferase involved in cell wall biosynthesis
MAGLSGQTQVPDQIVLVDSGSADATVSIAEKLGAETVTIDPEDFTFGSSLNRGFEACHTDFVLVVSAHVYPIFDSFVANMVLPMQDPDVAISYGRQVGDQRTHFSEWRIMHRWFPEAGSGRQDHPFSNNANACVRREVWDALRYDEELTGLEDIDFATRAQAKGWQVHYVAEAPVVHVHQESLSQIRNRYRREAIAYARLHPGWRMGAVDAVATASSNILADWTHALVSRRTLTQIAKSATFRTAQFLGSWEGARSGQSVSESVRRRMYYPAPVGPLGEFDGGIGRPIDYGSGIHRGAN